MYKLTGSSLFLLTRFTKKCGALILVVERMMNVARTKIPHEYAMESRKKKKKKNLDMHRQRKTFSHLFF